MGPVGLSVLCLFTTGSDSMSSASEYCEVIKNHIRLTDRISEDAAEVYMEDGYMLPSQIVEIYGDHLPIFHGAKE